MNVLQWLKDKFGRIVSGVGVILSGVESFDITAVKAPLEELIGHKGVIWSTLLLFAASWARHQYVANQHPK